MDLRYSPTHMRKIYSEICVCVCARARACASVLVCVSLHFLALLSLIQSQTSPCWYLQISTYILLAKPLELEESTSATKAWMFKQKSQDCLSLL